MTTVKDQATLEFNEELRRDAIEEEKARLRLRGTSPVKRFFRALQTKKLVIRLENKK